MASVGMVCAVEGEGITLSFAASYVSTEKKKKKKGEHTFVPTVVRVAGDGVRRYYHPMYALSVMASVGRVCAMEGEGITLPVCCQSRQYRKKEEKRVGTPLCTLSLSTRRHHTLYA